MEQRTSVLESAMVVAVMVRLAWEPPDDEDEDEVEDGAILRPANENEAARPRQRNREGAEDGGRGRPGPEAV
jgi:hypothetical protein